MSNQIGFNCTWWWRNKKNFDITKNCAPIDVSNNLQFVCTLNFIRKFSCHWSEQFKQPYEFVNFNIILKLFFTVQETAALQLLQPKHKLWNWFQNKLSIFQRTQFRYCLDISYLQTKFLREIFQIKRDNWTLTIYIHLSNHLLEFFVCWRLPEWFHNDLQLIVRYRTTAIFVKQLKRFFEFCKVQNKLFKQIKFGVR